MKKVCVVGSINMDIFLRVESIPVIGETVLAREIFYGRGGKGENQAIAMSRLGCDVEMIGCVGDDENGKILLEGLKSDSLSDGTKVELGQDSLAWLRRDAGATMLLKGPATAMARAPCCMKWSSAASGPMAASWANPLPCSPSSRTRASACITAACMAALPTLRSRGCYSTGCSEKRFIKIFRNKYIFI